MQVLEFALQLEADGKAYYQKLAEGSPSKELKHLFTLLADAEQAHYEVLLAWEKGSAAAKIESETLDRARNVFQQLMEMRDAMDQDGLAVDLDGYRRAIMAEEQSIRFYLEAAEQESVQEVRELLLALAHEEKLHLNIIENIYEFVESPRYFLEWREFSNLKTL